MTNHGSVHSCNENFDHVCHHHTSNPSVHQTLDEVDFERGIWNSAFTGDNEEVERKLLKSHGSDVNETDKAGYTALHYACRNGHLKVCETLLSYSANVNATTPSSKATSLHRAAYMGHTQIVSLLLEHQADPSALDCDGMTPLHKASENDQSDTVDILLKVYPAAKNVEDKRGRKPNDLAKSDIIKGKLIDS